jgi:hypothetical protein
MRRAMMAMLLTACAGGSSPEATIPEAPRVDAGAALPADAGAASGSVSTDPDAGTLAEADIPQATILRPDGGAPGDCEGLLPAALPPVVVHVEPISEASNEVCGIPLASGDGAVAYRASYRPGWTFLDASGQVTGRFAFWSGDIFAQAKGFIGYSGSSVLSMVAAAVLDKQGGVAYSPNVLATTGFFAADPNGGLLAVGQLAPGGPEPDASTPLSALMFARDGSIRWGPVALGTSAQIRSVAVDLAGRSLVLFDGARLFGPGSLAGEWFDAAGIGSEPFVVLDGGADKLGFALAPLQPDGLALQSLRAPFVFDETVASEWVSVLPSGKNATAPVPEWLAQRPNTRIAIARGGRGYAVLPNAAHLAKCDQQLELVSLEGSSCGRIDFPLDDFACVSRPLTLGLDGTVMQMLPPAREPFDPVGSAVRDCTLRYWPAALR